MKHTKISWANHTWNPWRGCVEVSPACDHCYARVFSRRNPNVLGTWGTEAEGGIRVVGAETTWQAPLGWDHEAAQAGERHRVFCLSLGDIFEDWHGHMLDVHGSDILWIDSEESWATYGGSPQPFRWDRHVSLTDVRWRVGNTIARTPNLDYLLLTKRPQNARAMLGAMFGANTASNVWVGTTVEDRKHGFPRIDHLRKIDASVRFLSIEPLLEDLGQLDLTGISWVIVGGESGPESRPMHPRWVRSIRDQCIAAGVPFHFKQWGDWFPLENAGKAVINQRVGFFDAVDCWYPDTAHPLRQSMARVGKVIAGRTLDGRIWDEVPMGVTCNASS